MADDRSKYGCGRPAKCDVERQFSEAVITVLPPDRQPLRPRRPETAASAPRPDAARRAGDEQAGIASADAPPRRGQLPAGGSDLQRGQVALGLQPGLAVGGAL